jgi:hypothetical protein
LTSLSTRGVLDGVLVLLVLRPVLGRLVLLLLERLLRLTSSASVIKSYASLRQRDRDLDRERDSERESEGSFEFDRLRSFLSAFLGASFRARRPIARISIAKKPVTTANATNLKTVAAVLLLVETWPLLSLLWR